MTVINVKTPSEFYSLIQSKKPSLVDFTATWCGPCRVIKPYFAELAKACPGVQFLQVDVDQVPEASHWAGVRAMPTFIAYKEGRKLSELVGVDKTALHDMVLKLTKF